MTERTVEWTIEAERTEAERDDTTLNRLALRATLAARGELRHTPAGIPAIDCTLLHRSTQAEAGGERKVECELHAVAFGEVARRLSSVEAGSAVECEGFLARRYRTGVAVAFHITGLTVRTGSTDR